jgi:plasmid stabilization system protein ParE
MKKYELLISDKAFMDMENIYNYIAEQLQAPETAMQQYNRIADAIEKLESLPERIRVMESEPEWSMGLRPLIVDNYTAFFVIRDLTVTVVRVLYSSSDITKRLSED